MSTVIRRLITAIAAAALLLLGACSGGGAADRPALQSEPTVSTPADETPTPMNDDFATAVKFTKLSHAGEYGEAAELVVPESPAARYLAHQAKYAKARRIAGDNLGEDPKPKVTGDPAAGVVKIKFEKTEDDSALSYSWKDFTFEQGKITGWTGKSGPVKDVLWTRTTSDSKLGVKGKLESAYLSNGGSLVAVVELSASKDRGFGDAEYSAKAGYRQAVSGQNASDLSKGEKTLAYFSFDDAKFGGTLHIPFYDGTGSSYGDWTLHLKIK